jgi:glucose-6-phosphate isomerase
MIRFDFSGTSDTLIGNRGVSLKDIEAIMPLCTKAHETMAANRAEGRIKFQDLPDDKKMMEAVKSLVKKLKGKFRNIVHLGIGGSSLGPKAMFSSIKPPFYNLDGNPRIFFWDNVDPEFMSVTFEHIKLDETLFIVVSKSGGTAETASQFMFVYDKLRKQLGEKYKDHLAIITDPRGGILRKIADSEGIANLPIPPEVGGRFSTLTPVGLLPSALLGIDIDAFMRGAGKMRDKTVSPDVFSNPAYLYAVIHFLASAKSANMSVLMPYSNALFDLSDWYCQLWAESSGKKTSLKGKTVFAGQTPIKALGATDQHSQCQLYMEGPFDKVVNIIDVKKYRKEITIPDVFGDTAEMGYLCGKTINKLIQSEAIGTWGALIENNRMATRITLDAINEETIGAMFMFFMTATSFFCYLLDVNPYDQPGVELGKVITFDLMGRKGYEGKAKPVAEVDQLVLEVK